jgi:hypothetical protein
VSVTLDQSSTLSLLTLEGELDIGDALELKNLLVHALTAAQELRLRFTAPLAMDITVMQLLIAARRGAKASGIPFSVDEPVPEDVVRAFSVAGLQPIEVGQA